MLHLFSKIRQLKAEQNENAIVMPLGFSISEDNLTNNTNYLSKSINQL